MNEFILNALLQLFAIIANVSEDGVSFKARNIVKSYLFQHLSTNLLNKYLSLFDDYLRIHHPEVFSEEGEKGIKTVSDSEKVIEIGKAINRNLLQREKFLVFLRLVEFINEDEVMTKKELGFIKTVANTFNISESEQKNIISYVMNPRSPEIERDKILIIDDKTKTSDPKIKHIHAHELDGEIVILQHASTATYVFRYLGGASLYLNGYNILPGRIELMEQGSMITGPKISPVYFSDISRKFHHSEKAPGIRFVAENIEYQFKNSTKGIKKFNFDKKSGNLIGIMGGSGVGKSTLLNLLSGKLEPQSGRITINGIDIYEEKEKIEGVIGFVPQDDLLMEELTVFENLYYNAKLCLSNFSDREILSRVDQILIDLELDDIKHLKVGNPIKKLISGGQRKRLNFGLELIREPGVLFIDEPTSGLSSMDSEKVMHLLKEQAIKGRLVIANIHQPFSDIFKLFDRIIIVDKGGYVIYKGNPIDAIIYFKTLSNYVNAEEGHCLSCGNVMPEEILKIVESREVDEYGKLTKDRRVSPEEWHRIYRERIESKQEIKPVKQKLPKVDFKTPGLLSQLRIFILRNVRSKMANRQYMLINFLEAPLLALIIGFFIKYRSDLSSPASYVFRENVNLPAYLFMAIIVALFMGLMISAEEIIKDRKILERETFLRLSRLSYLHSKILVLFVISAIQTFSFVLVGNLILEIKGMLFYHWAILFTVSCLACMLGLNISSGLNSIVTTYIIIPFIVVPQLLFSGLLINFDKMNNLLRRPDYVPIIGEVMTCRWAYESIAVNQFKKNRFNREFYSIDQIRSNASYNIDLISNLEIRMNNAYYKMSRDINMDECARSLDLVRNELQKQVLSTTVGSEPAGSDLVAFAEDIEKLNIDWFDREVYNSISGLLDNLKSGFADRRNEADRMKELKSAALLEEWGGTEGFIRVKKDYTNDRLEEILTNRRQLRGIIEWNNRLVRKMTPIYMEPLSRYGRAHFYAPVKKLGNLSIDTYWFNVCVIWLSTLVFYLTLVYDVLRRFTNWTEIRKKRKKR